MRVSRIGPFLHSSLHMPRSQSSHLDPILSGGRNYFATVKLQRRHGVVIFDCLEDTACAQVPDLYKKKKKEQRVRERNSSLAAQVDERGTHPHRFIQASAYDVNFVKLKARHGARMPQERPVGLASSHVPHSNCAVPASTHKGILPRLHGSNEVLIQFPAPISVRWGRHCECSRSDGRANDRETGHVPRGQRGWV